MIRLRYVTLGSGTNAPALGSKSIRRVCMRAWILTVVSVVGLISLPAHADHRHYGYPHAYVRPYVGFSYGFGAPFYPAWGYYDPWYSPWWGPRVGVGVRVDGTRARVTEKAA